MIVIVEIQALCRKLCVSTSMICLHVKFYMLWASISLVSGHHIERYRIFSRGSFAVV
jgi:hypothetical protein